MGMECAAGEGMCYRPCGTYLHVTECPSLYCQWNTGSESCIPKAPDVPTYYWTATTIGATPMQQGKEVVDGTSPSVFPMSLAEFRLGAEGFRIQGILLENITKIEHLFLDLDKDIDGDLSPAEFGNLPKILNELTAAVTSERMKQETVMMSASERRLQGTKVSPEVCNARRPKQYYCSFDVSCKLDCVECGWKSATDRAFSTCVQPSADVCNADGGKVYCATDELCHPPGDCSTCVDRPLVDFSQHTCLALWWDPEPLPQWTNWVCRFRNKVGMPCRNDQDCIYGMRRCLTEQCMPFQPYNANQTCFTDLDCPHLGYYCPSDPTGGQNPYWVQYCRAQRSDGMTCKEDRECGPDMLCNTGEPQPRCRTLFSLDIGTPAAFDVFCQSGWRDVNSKCAPAARSKQVGRTCDDDSDCATTDETGRSGRCTCKDWWDADDSKFCAPVSGDYARHQEAQRNFLWFRATNCGSFWTEDECLRIFGNQASTLKLTVECETQKLSGGPYMPPADCGIDDPERFVDKCKQLAMIR
ncbi:unnamed protein product [Polarella glacialis]|uniref:EF-hand domain-containing protein n=1 Tax=Polarella glacialis TaxID=89957 RepID=A0A813E2T6_POLGL|nr:unnamed protein product [Polarella glacialis]